MYTSRVEQPAELEDESRDREIANQLKQQYNILCTSTTHVRESSTLYHIFDFWATHQLHAAPEEEGKISAWVLIPIRSRNGRLVLI